MSAEKKPVITLLNRSTWNSEQSYELKPAVSASISQASSVPELISYLKSAFRDEEFSLVEGILMDREKQLRTEIRNLKTRRRRDLDQLKDMENQLKDMKGKCEELENGKAEAEAKLKMYEEKFKQLEKRISLQEEKAAQIGAVDVSVIQKLVDDLEADDDDVVEVNSQASGADGDPHEKLFLLRATSVDSTGNGSGKSRDEDPLPINLACEDRAPSIDLSACEAEDYAKHNLVTVSARAGSSTVVHISDSDSDDENAKACVSESNGVGRNLTFPHQKKDDVNETSLSKRKRSLTDGDNGDGSSFGKQKTESIQELHRGGKPSFAHDNSHKTVFVRRCDDKDGGKSYSQLSYRRSDLQKLDGIGDDSSSDSENDPLSDKSINMLIQRKRITKRKMLSSEDDLGSSFEKDPELCMNAICALYRRQISPNISSKSQGLDQFDKISIVALGEYLIDGDPENKLRKAVVEVRPKDHAECKRIATKYCHQLYQIYLSKEDHLFCPNLKVLV